MTASASPERQLMKGADVRTYPTRRIGVAICSVSGCEQVVFARGWCSRHWTRWRRHGDPLGGRPDTVEERFWQKVHRGAADECWTWLAARDEHGYGQFRDGTSPHMARAHRTSWMLAHGAIPEDLQVLHRCDHPACVNPAHLFLGSQQDNVSDMLAKGRRVKRGRKT